MVLHPLAPCLTDLSSAIFQVTNICQKTFECIFKLSSIKQHIVFPWVITLPCKKKNIQNYFFPDFLLLVCGTALSQPVNSQSWLFFQYPYYCEKLLETLRILLH